LDPLAPPTPLDSSLIGFAIALAALVVFYLARAPEERGWIFRLAIWTFVVKAILVFAYFEWLVWIGEFGFAYFDARGHHEQAIDMLTEIEYDVPHVTWGWFARDPGMYRLTAWTYMLFGPNTLVVRFFLISFISMSLLYLYRISKMFCDEQTARLATLLTAILPWPVLTTLNHRKEPIVQLIVLFMFYHAFRVFRQEPGWLRSVAFTFIGLVMIYPFRSGLILPFLGVMVICFVLANRNPLQGAVLAVVTILGLVILQLAVPDDSKIGLGTYGDRVEKTLDASARRAQLSGVASLLRMTGPIDIYKLPFAGAAYLILPFPPDFVGYPPAVLGNAINIFGVLLLPHMILGVWSMIRGPDWRLQLPILVFPVVFLLVIGAVHIGVIRYKLIFYPVCMIWAAIGWRIGTGLFLKLAVYGGLTLLSIPIYLNRFNLL